MFVQGLERVVSKDVKGVCVSLKYSRSYIPKHWDVHAQVLRGRKTKLSHTTTGWMYLSGYSCHWPILPTLSLKINPQTRFCSPFAPPASWSKSLPWGPRSSVVSCWLLVTSPLSLCSVHMHRADLALLRSLVDFRHMETKSESFQWSRPSMIRRSASIYVFWSPAHILQAFGVDGPGLKTVSPPSSQDLLYLIIEVSTEIPLLPRSLPPPPCLITL